MSRETKQVSGAEEEATLCNSQYDLEFWTIIASLNDFEIAVRTSKLLEHILVDHLQAVDVGTQVPENSYVPLHKMITSARCYGDKFLPKKLQNQMRYLASVRNGLVHERGYSELADRATFLEEFKGAYKELMKIVNLQKFQKPHLAPESLGTPSTDTENEGTNRYNGLELALDANGSNELPEPELEKDDKDLDKQIDLKVPSFSSPVACKTLQSKLLPNVDFVPQTLPTAQFESKVKEERFIQGLLKVETELLQMQKQISQLQDVALSAQLNGECTLWNRMNKDYKKLRNLERQRLSEQSILREAASKDSDIANALKEFERRIRLHKNLYTGVGVGD